MKHRLPHSHPVLLAVLIWLSTQIHAAVDRAAREKDRGSNVVETIIIVAGFAILAAGIYTAVSGKVHTWMAKIP